MELYFVRHGQSTNNHIFDSTGSNMGRSDDPELTEIGSRQLIHLEKFFMQEKRALDEAGIQKIEVLSSPMVRAIRTARAVAEGLHTGIQLMADLHEVGGIYLDDETNGARVGRTGKTRDELNTLFPDLDLPDWVRPEGWWNRAYETWDEGLERGRRAANAVLARWAEEQTALVLVSHNAFFQCFLRGLVMAQWPRECWFLMQNTAISRFSLPLKGRVDVRYINWTAHLPASLLTM